MEEIEKEIEETKNSIKEHEHMLPSHPLVDGDIIFSIVGLYEDLAGLYAEWQLAYKDPDKWEIYKKRKAEKIKAGDWSVTIPLKRKFKKVRMYYTKGMGDFEIRTAVEPEALNKKIAAQQKESRKSF